LVAKTAIGARNIGQAPTQMAMPSAMREDFLKNYLGSELDPLWLETVSKLTAKGAGRISWPATKTASRNYARKFAHLRPTPVSTSASSAKSSIRHRGI
jgi:hypothetical protein